MSGGHFDYKQYNLDYIADEIKQLVLNNQKKDEWGNSRSFPVDILEKFQETIYALKRVEAMVRRIDWLVSGDDGEETFKSRWQEEVCEKYPTISEKLIIKLKNMKAQDLLLLMGEMTKGELANVQAYGNWIVRQLENKSED